MSTTFRNGRLTREQIAEYARDGYVLFHHPVFSPERFAQLTTIFEEDRARYGDEDLDTIHFRDARLLEYLLADEVLDLVEPLVGPDIGVWSSHFITKAPRTGKATPWHEDSAYWQGRISTMIGLCTVWLALDETTPENGSMAVIPGSQTNGFSAYEAVDPGQNIFARQIKQESFDESQAVTFRSNPMSAVSTRRESSMEPAPTRAIVGGQVIRCATSRRRVGSTTITPTIANHKIWLARGRDRAGNQYENA